MEFAPCATDIRACGVYLFLSWPAYQFIQPRLALCEGRFGLLNSGKYSRVVLPQKQVTSRYMLTLYNRNLDNRFKDLGPDLDPIGLELTDDPRVIIGRIAGCQYNNYRQCKP